MSQLSELHTLLEQLDTQAQALDGFRQAIEGERPAAFLSKSSRAALDASLGRLSANYPRMLVRTYTDRLRLHGFRLSDGPPDSPADRAAWDRFRRAGLVPVADFVHADRLTYGAAFVTVWGAADDPTRPVATADSPRTMLVLTDAAGEPLDALRRWTAGDTSHAVRFLPDAIRRYRANTGDAPAGSGAWQLVETIPNPFGVIPVTPFTRRTGSDDHAGTSLIADVLDLSDAVAKVLQDMLVTSEHAARPRRWVTGLEIEEDDDGNVIDPFANDRKLQSESPDTKFGQLPPTGLDAYGSMLTSLLQQLGAVAGLPAHYLGNIGSEPPNADSIRAAEAQLTTAALGEQRQLDAPWCRVAGFLAAVESPSSTDPLEHAGRLESVWGSPELRTPAQAADAAMKLQTIGVPLRTLLTDTLGHTPESADAIVQASRAETIARAAEQLGKLRP